MPWLMDFFNHKSHKRKKRKKENEWCWKAEPQKEQRKTKGTKQNGGCLEYGMP